jgi:hypothetical protein
MIWVAGQAAYFFATTGDHGLGDPTGRWWLGFFLLVCMPGLLCSLVVAYFVQRRFLNLASPLRLAICVVASAAAAGLGTRLIWFAFIRELPVSMTAMIIPASLGAIATLIFLPCQRYLVGDFAA